MPLGPTEVVQYHQPTALDALTQFMGQRAQRESDDQEAQDKIKQHQADQQAAQQQQIALHIIAEVGKSGGIDGINQFLTDNPQVGHYLLRPDSSADAIAHKEQVRLVSTPMDDAEATAKGMKPLNATEKMERTKFIYNLKDVADRVIAAGALGGDAAAKQAATNEAGITMTASQAATEAERKRHNVTDETQLAPVRGAETYRDTQQGNASRESATNRSQERDVNSPFTQTQIKKAVSTVQGESTIPNRPKASAASANFVDPAAPDFKEHPALRDYNNRLRALAKAHDAIAAGEGAAAKLDPATKKARLDQIAQQIVSIKQSRQAVADKLNVPVTAQDALNNPKFKKAPSPAPAPAPQATPPPVAPSAAPAPVTHKEWRNGAWVVVNGPPGGPVSQNMNTPSFDGDGADTEDTNDSDYAAS